MELRAFAAAAAAAATNAAIAFGGRAAMDAAYAAAFAAADAATSRAATSRAAAYSAHAAVQYADAFAAASAMWAAVSFDANFIATGGNASDLADRPLWRGERPDWARPLPVMFGTVNLKARDILDWFRLQRALPSDEDWDVWIRWYYDRLAGRSHSEAHELVFATVPQKKWDESPAAANRWIKDELKKIAAKEEAPESPASLPGELKADSQELDSQKLDDMTRDTRGVFDVELDAANRLTPTLIPVPDGVEDIYGFAWQKLYLDMRRGFSNFAAHVENHRAGNFHFSDELKQRARMLLDAAPEDVSQCPDSWLAINRELVAALLALEYEEKSGNLPPHSMILHHRNELRGFYRLLDAFCPGLVKYREMAANNRFYPPGEQAERAGKDILRQVAADETVAAPRLAKEFRDAISALEAGRLAVPAHPTEAQIRQANLEPNKSAAAQIVPVWNWLANAREKFLKSGKTAEDNAKAIESFERLYKTLSHAKDYFDWLSSWFY